MSGSDRQGCGTANGESSNRTPAVQNLLTVWDLLKNGARHIVFSDEKEGMLFTYESSAGELAMFTLTYNASQGAGWWMRAMRKVRAGLPFDNAKAQARLWHFEWVEQP